MARDWQQLYNNHRGEWVALRDDHVTLIAAGATREAVRQAAKQAGFDKPFIVKMPSDLMAFAG